MTPGALALLPLLPAEDVLVAHDGTREARPGAWGRLAARLGVTRQRVYRAVAPGAPALRAETIAEWATRLRTNDAAWGGIAGAIIGAAAAGYPAGPRPPTCKGYGYHVFTLGASRCSICGWDRYAGR